MVLIYLITLAIILILVYLRLRRSEESKMYSSKELTVLEVTTSKLSTEEEDIGSSSISAENMFVSFHGLLHDEISEKDIVSCEMVFSGRTGIKFYVTCPNEVARFVESQLYAHHPNLTVKAVADYTPSIPDDDQNVQVVEASLNKEYFFPIKTHRDFEADPISSFTSALSNLDTDEEFWFQVVTKPIPDTWQEEGLNYVTAVKEGKALKQDSIFKIMLNIITAEIIEVSKKIIKGAFVTIQDEEIKPATKEVVKLTSNQENEINVIENKIARVGYMVNIRAVSYSPDSSKSQATLRSFIASLKQYTSVAYNSFNVKVIVDDGLLMYKSRYFSDDSNIILNSEELATIYHFPYSKVETPNISWEYSKLSEPPSNLPTDNCIYMGDTLFRNKKTRFGIHNDNDRLRHMYLVGKSGVGKSTLFQVMATQDIKNGEGVCVLDPHGETIEKILDYIPDERIDDVIYIDPSDYQLPVGLNLLEVEDISNIQDTNVLASGLLAAVRHHFDYSWGPRLDYLLNNCLLTLTRIKGTTMLSIVRLLIDKNYRNYIVHQLDDPVLKKFWEEEYKEYATNQKFITEAIAPIQNKINRFLSSPIIRNLLSQAKSTVDIKDIMDNKKILLVNLSKGKIGSDNANLLGALIVSRIQYYALQRAKIPEEQRSPFYLYVDEFQNFATGSFTEILSESRKYGLGLYLTNQYTNQLEEDILHAVLGNVGTIATFSAGSEDAKIMANEFTPFTEEDIITLKRFQIYIKLMIDGMTSLPFSAKILLPWEDSEFLPTKNNNKEEVIKRSRERYGTDKNYIEAKIEKWINIKFDKGMAIAKYHRERKMKQEIEANQENESLVSIETSDNNSFE